MSDQVLGRSVAPSLGPREVAELRQFAERWKGIGEILDADRWFRLQAASDEELRRRSLDLLTLWQADLPGDDGEAILLHQRTFALMGARERV